MSEAVRILVVDDEAPARERLATLLADIADALPNILVGSVADGLAALNILSIAVADVVLTDIRMPRMGGLELASHLQRCEESPAVIFTTAYDHHAVQAFELNAIDYLVKPIRAERLLAALRRVGQGGSGRSSARDSANVLSLGLTTRRFFSCMERGKLLVVPVADVLYLRADAKYVIARTLDREYVLDESLQKLEEEFKDLFLRLHRSVLVAKNAICSFEKIADGEGDHWEALLKGLPERLTVSRRQWPQVKKIAGR